ncbi:MAG: UDP-3-O-(3-hydroxymyristoyl)glucosamine N-acyltransferase [Chitinophagaceae bacterium]|nr:UDP-3-O-(3-hydroxymyristoyl)glucosamine N-acyltransferase [Chitinophagaceae bacterium]
MQFSATQIALLINGKIEGDPNATVSSFGKIEEAKAGQLAFLANPKYEEFLYHTSASVVIINNDLELKHPIASTLIRVPDAYTAFAALLTKYQEMQQQQLSGRQDPSYVASTAKIGEQVYIGAFVYIGENVTIGDHTKLYPGVFIGDNAKIGSGTVLHPGVKIYHHCEVGNQVIIHGGTVIGADGFGFAPQQDGSYQKVPQIGNVVIEDRVEIGANTCIDRATMGSTLIKAGAKLDNMIQIAHNVEVGNFTVIAAQTGISGSTKLGKNVMIGGQAGIAGHLQVGDGAKINAQSGLGKNLKPGQSVTGSPAYDYGQAIRAQSTARNLPEIEKRLRELEALVKKLSAYTSSGDQG